jgi:hypothetical protein
MQKDILVSTDERGGIAVLTTASPASSHGIPVLRIEAEDVSGDFGPSDLIGEPGNLITAASVVAGWIERPGRTAEEFAAARKFLGQWPEGPQIKAQDEYKRITLRLPFEMWKRMLSLTIDSKLAGKNETVTDIALTAIERELNRRERAGK